MPGIVKGFARRGVVAFHDLVVVAIAWFAAYWLRFNLETIPPRYLSEALDILPFLLLIQGAAFWFFGLYRGIWRFASLPDLVRIGEGGSSRNGCDRVTCLFYQSFARRAAFGISASCAAAGFSRWRAAPLI